MFKPGALEVYGEADWKLGSVPAIYEASFSFWDNQIQYNQLDTGATDCTLYASMGAVSSLTGKVRTLPERKAIHDKAIKEGLDPKVGRWAHKAIDLIRREYNKTVLPAKALSSYLVKINSPEFWDVIYSGYTVCAGYKGNRAYNEDVNDNCILENDDIGESTYAHFIGLTVKGKFIYIVDNYFGKKICNVYRVDVFKQLVMQGVFFTNGYIFLNTEKPMENRLPPHMTPEQAPRLSDEIKARENEMPAYIKNGNRYAANNYMLPSNNLHDKNEHLKVWVKMFADLNNARK